MLLGMVALALVPATDALAARVRAQAAVGPDAHAARTVTLFGSRALGRSVAHQEANRAEAFSYTARSSGTARSVGLYVQSRARATRLRVAVYSNGRGRPGVLLTAGSALRPRARAWNRIGVRGAHLVAGRRYWLVVLPARGRVALRYRRTRACAGADRRRIRMSTLPRRWRSRAAMQGCQVSAYVSGASGAVRPTGGSGPTPPGSPSPPTPPSSPVLQTKNCFSTPSACGYPDQTNTGVPAGTPLTTFNGDQQINAPGTYYGLERRQRVDQGQRQQRDDQGQRRHQLGFHRQRHPHPVGGEQRDDRGHDVAGYRRKQRAAVRGPERRTHPRSRAFGSTCTTAPSAGRARGRCRIPTPLRTA